MSGPGIPKKVVDTPVSLVDVMPTILDTLDLPIPASVDGRVAPHNQPVYMEAFMLQDRLGLAPHFGLVKGNEKLIDVPRPELYRLDVDPSEQSDLASDQMESVVSLKQTIDGFGFAPEIRPRRFRWIRRLRNSLKHSAMSSLRRRWNQVLCWKMPKIIKILLRGLRSPNGCFDRSRLKRQMCS